MFKNKTFFKSKCKHFLDIPSNTSLNPILIKERKIKIGIHNTHTFINSTGIQNGLSLTKKENTLFFKGVSHIDNYFPDDLCGFIIELNYFRKINL